MTVLAFPLPTKNWSFVVVPLKTAECNRTASEARDHERMKNSPVSAVVAAAAPAVVSPSQTQRAAPGS